MPKIKLISVLRRTMDKKRKLKINAMLKAETSQEELVDRIIQLEAHNKQLKSIISKNNSGGDLQGNERKRKRLFDFSRYPKQHIAIKLLYLGWEYQGFASIEDSTRTIEHHLFAALTTSCLVENRESSNYNRCGRTDKTVSAFDQVITLTVRAAKEGEPSLEYCKVLNRLLPKDIRVVAWKQVPENFSARFDCKKRTYRYFFPRGDLDLNAMQQGAERLVGTHDFRNLCKMDVANGVIAFERTIENADVRVLSTSSLNNSGYDMCELVLSSKGFLWHQVRCIMGVLLLIGQGMEKPDVVSYLLDISLCPQKPQYSLAIGEPLNLFHCEFDLEGDWVLDTCSLAEVIKTLQQEWSLHSIKQAMVGQMLSGLESASGGLGSRFQSSGLLQGTKSKVYIPLLKRPTCDSLEARIAHFVKKKRIEVSSDESDVTKKI